MNASDLPMRKDVRRCPTLPHPRGCSTIGAVKLSFRVRNGTGRFPHAMTAETSFLRKASIDPFGDSRSHFTAGTTNAARLLSQICTVDANTH